MKKTIEITERKKMIQDLIEYCTENDIKVKVFPTGAYPFQRTIERVLGTSTTQTGKYCP